MGFDSVKLRRAVEEQGRTVRWLARQCGVTDDTIRKALQGTRIPSLPVLKLMAIALERPDLDPDHRQSERVAVG
jgi:transcriptional regulator with XRE-family HTH domain